MMGTMTPVTPTRQRSEGAVDARLGVLPNELRDMNHFPLAPEIAAKFIRAAYGKGYVDALETPATDPLLTSEVPMVAHPELFLP